MAGSSQAVGEGAPVIKLLFGEPPTAPIYRSTRAVSTEEEEPLSALLTRGSYHVGGLHLLGENDCDLKRGTIIG